MHSFFHRYVITNNHVRMTLGGGAWLRDMVVFRDIEYLHGRILLMAVELVCGVAW
jgi:hypothetical protein